jgi:N-acetylglutamate synthase-like GNAT family acetyltransferase
MVMEHPVIQLRQATPNDAPAACDLLRRAIEDGCAADHGGCPDVLGAWLGNKTPANVQTWFSSPANHAVLAELDARLVGLALLNQAGKLALCYVRPDLVRTGVGRALLGAVEVQARQWNISKIYMHSPASATPFFERLGYVNAGKDKACFGLEMDFLWKQLDGAAPPPGKRFCNCGE